MIVSFKDKGTKDVFDGNDSKDARKTCSINLWNVAQIKLDQLNAAISLDDMKAPLVNRLEALKSGRKGQYSIRINDQYRICFVWKTEGACEIKIVDYHD